MRVVTVARKPCEGSITANVVEHEAGALNIDECRIETDDDLNGGAYSEGGRKGLPGDAREGAAAGMFVEGGGRLPGQYEQPTGRWPANVILTRDGATELDRQSGTLTSGSGTVKRASSSGRDGNQGAAYGAESRPDGTPMIWYGDSEGASRYFKVVAEGSEP